MFAPQLQKNVEPKVMDGLNLINEEENVSEIDSEVDEYEYKTQDKIFINYLNSYHGKNLVEVLTAHGKDSENLNLESKSSEGDFSSNEDHDTTKPDDAELEENFELTKKYKIYGTIEENDLRYSNDLPLTIDILNPKDENFVESVLKCGTIIYDINRDSNQIVEAFRIMAALEEQSKKLSVIYWKDPVPEEMRRQFILISSIMTWFATEIPDKDEDEPELLTEESYRKRRPHSCYVKHLKLEKEVMNLQKRHKHFLRTVVVCPGITYGGANDVFHYLFKSAYLNKAELDIYTAGTNVFPLIYVRDFARIIAKFIKKFPKRSVRYILAVQPESVDYFTLTKLIGKWVNSDHCRVKIIPKDEIVFSEKDVLTIRVYHHLQINLRMSPLYLEDYEFLIPDNLDEFGDQLAMEFRTERKLKPVKIVVAGAPCCGKTKLAIVLSKFYAIFPVSTRTIVQDTIQRTIVKLQQAEDYLNRLNIPFEDGIEDESSFREDEVNEIEDEGSVIHGIINETEIEDIKNNIIEWNLKLRELEDYSESITNGEELEFEIINRLIRERLLEKCCSENQGYVLHGLPYQYNQAKMLFGTEDNFDDEEVENELHENMFTIHEKLKPDLVVLIDGDADYLCSRAMQVLEKDASMTYNTETKFLKRLQEYRENCHEDVSLLNYFLDRDIIPIEFHRTIAIRVEEYFFKIKDYIGQPRVYPLSQAEIDEIQILEAENERLKEEEAERIKLEKERKEEDERHRRLEEWTDILIKLKSEEQKQLEIRSLPLRHYLMKYVLPTLIDGLIEIIKFKPEDSIDYLAEFLLRQDSKEKNQNSANTKEIKKLLLHDFNKLPDKEIETLQESVEEEFQNCLKQLMVAGQIDKILNDSTQEVDKKSND